jgi:hypothetical protein
MVSTVLFLKENNMDLPLGDVLSLISNQKKKLPGLIGAVNYQKAPLVWDTGLQMASLETNISAHFLPPGCYQELHDWRKIQGESSL